MSSSGIGDIEDISGHVSAVSRSGLSGLQSLQSFPTAVVDIIGKFAQFIFIRGEFLYSFEIDPASRVVPYQYVGKDIEFPDTALITQELCDWGNIYIIYNSLTGEQLRDFDTPPEPKPKSTYRPFQSSLDSLIPDGNTNNNDSDDDNDSYYCTIFNSDLNIAWSRDDNDFFDFALFGKTCKPSTHWIDKQNHVIHCVGAVNGGEEGEGVNGGGEGGGVNGGREGGGVNGGREGGGVHG